MKRGALSAFLPIGRPVSSPCYFPEKFSTASESRLMLRQHVRETGLELPVLLMEVLSLLMPGTPHVESFDLLEENELRLAHLDVVGALVEQDLIRLDNGRIREQASHFIKLRSRLSHQEFLARHRSHQQLEAFMLRRNVVLPMLTAQ